MTITFNRFQPVRINPRRTYLFYIRPGRGGGGATPPPLAVCPLIELELRGKHERVGRYETQWLLPKFKVSGQPIASQVRSMT